MSALSGSQRLPDHVDYTVSHRPAPARPSRDQQVRSPVPPPSRGDAASTKSSSGGRRRGSFSSLLRRGSSGNTKTKDNTASSSYTAADAPPVPVIDPARFSAGSDARASQASSSIPDAHAANNTASRSGSSLLHSGTRLRKNSFGRDPSPIMLRKTSRKQRELQLEQERLEREAYARRLAPHISLSPLPNISSFGPEDGDDQTAAYYNTAANSNPSAAAAAAAAYNPANEYGEFSNGPYQQQPRAPANFSRPAAMAPATNDNQSSSSPAYAARPAYHSYSSPATGTANGEYVAANDPTFPAAFRAESMTNRGRYSYASSTTQVNSINSPRRVRRRKDPTPFNVLVIGTKNSGKTSFISFLRHSLALSSNRHQPAEPVEAQDSRKTFTSHYLETEIDGERVGLTLWDSAGLEKNIVDLQLREMTAFVEAKFEDTFVEEQKVMRSPGVKDTHIHCVFLVLDPVRLDMTVTESMAKSKTGGIGAGSLDNDLDLLVMRSLWGKTTVIPVISKADTLTTGHMAYLKRAVSQSLKHNRLDPLEALELEDDSEDATDSDADSAVINNYPTTSADDEEQDRVPGLPSQPSKKSSHKRHGSLSSLSAINGTSSDGDELPYLPMSVLSPDPYDLPPYAKPGASAKIGRRFPWGFADPYDAAHCDFGRLRESVFSEWRADLRELSRTKWYENWRTSRLKHFPGNAGGAGARGAQRIKGGVTPVSSVPREARGGVRQVSASTTTSKPPAAAPPPPPSQATMLGVGGSSTNVPNGGLVGAPGIGNTVPSAGANAVPRSVSAQHQQNVVPVAGQPPPLNSWPTQEVLNAKTGALPGAFPGEA